VEIGFVDELKGILVLWIEFEMEEWALFILVILNSVADQK
jgi:hypothetical protein